METHAPTYSARSREVLDPRASAEQTICKYLVDAKLTAQDNAFFRSAKQVTAIDPEAALRIAVGWREITKAFMLTTIAGLGTMAAAAAEMRDPPEGLLATMQTAISVIGDDLNNVMPVFQRAAPKGIHGIHYLWWEESIVDRLRERLTPSQVAAGSRLPDGARELIAYMRGLGSTLLGAAVQLRIVEAIALEITIAFKWVFSSVVVDGQKVFASPDDFTWMDAHIEAEVEHNKAVSDDATGMTGIADTESKQEQMLRMTHEYVRLWSRALAEFHAHLPARSGDAV